MRMIEIDYEARPPIDAYGGGGFRIAAPAEATPEAFAAVLAEAGEIDVLLVGMGPDIAPLPRAAREAFEAAALGVETMSTAAACRTFNVLLAEDRRVAAALIAV